MAKKQTKTQLKKEIEAIAVGGILRISQKEIYRIGEQEYYIVENGKSHYFDKIDDLLKEVKK